MQARLNQCRTSDAADHLQHSIAGPQGGAVVTAALFVTHGNAALLTNQLGINCWIELPREQDRARCFAQQHPYSSCTVDVSELSFSSGNAINEATGAVARSGRWYEHMIQRMQKVLLHQQSHPELHAQAGIAFVTFPSVDVVWAVPSPVTWLGGTQPPGCNTITGPAPHPADMFPPSAMTPECWLAAYGQFHTVRATKECTAPTLEYYQMSTPACLLYMPQLNTTYRVNVDAARTRDCTWRCIAGTTTVRKWPCVGGVSAINSFPCSARCPVAVNLDTGGGSRVCIRDTHLQGKRQRGVPQQSVQ